MTAQYIVSSHPAVVAAMEENTYRYMAFCEAVFQWGASRGGIALYTLASTGAHCSGLDRSPMQGHGLWQDCEGVWRPETDNVVEHVLLSALSATWLNVPGLPANVWVRGSQQASRPFLAANGNVYVGYTDLPQVQGISHRWQPTTADDYNRAKSALTPPSRFDWEALA